MRCATGEKRGAGILHKKNSTFPLRSRVSRVFVCFDSHSRDRESQAQANTYNRPSRIGPGPNFEGPSSGLPNRSADVDEERNFGYCTQNLNVNLKTQEINRSTGLGREMQRCNDEHKYSRERASFRPRVIYRTTRREYIGKKEEAFQNDTTFVS